MKALYCVENGYKGYSYERVYVWASSKEEALDMAQKKYKEVAENSTLDRDPDYWEDLSIKKLFAETSDDFCTEPSDSGFVFDS